jgi:hypothetical protein
VNGARWGVAGGQGGDAQYAGDPVFETHLYTPTSANKWSTLANSIVPRLYHSGVLLLPSGHILTTGSEMQNYADTDPSCFPKGRRVCTNPYEYRLELFTPPYLQGVLSRPRITRFPGSLTYTSIFSVALADSRIITRACMIRYSTTTHSTNMVNFS